MASNKLQHFVPRVLLKRFAREDNARAISLFNFKSNKTVLSAPLKGQCAKNYLYGEDLIIERELAVLESLFGNICEKIIEGVQALSDTEIEGLRLFTLTQMFRTEQAIERTRSMFETMHFSMFHDIENPPDKEDWSDKALAKKNIDMAKALYYAVADLQLCIISNITKVDFVVSDSPALATNRLYIQRYKTGNFGLGQAGCILYLPISPKFVIMFYDKDVYTTSGSKNITVKKIEDLFALNTLTILEAKQNIYFKSNLEQVKKFVDAVRTNFVPRWHSNSVYAPNTKSLDSDIYHKVDNMHRQEGSMIYVSSVHYPDPKSWLTLLKFKHNMTAYTNFSATGYVRRHTAMLDQVEVKKIYLRKSPHPITSDNHRTAMLER